MLKAYAAAAVKSLGEVSITFKTNSKNINAALLTEYTEKIAAAGEAGLPALIEELAARLGSRQTRTRWLPTSSTTHMR